MIIYRDTNSDISIIYKFLEIKENMIFFLMNLKY